jgi:carboxyl-terminal processing protease
MFVDRRLVLDSGDLPFTAAYLDGKWVVTQSWSEGVNRGDIVESIDGEPFERFFANHRRYISASTEPFARRALFGRHPFFVPYAHLFPKKFVVGLDGGHSVSVDRSKLAPAPLEQTDGRWLEPGKVAYIRIPSFGAPEYEKRAIELLRELRQAAVLIVDVRGNSGGSTPSGLLAQLMDRPYHWWSESTSVTMPYFRYRASQGEWQYQPFNRPEFVWPSSVSQPAQDSFKGKMALLVDAGCLSACEDFTMPFKDNGRALLVGETTGGSTGQPFFLDLGNEMFLVVGAKRAMFPDGSRFEGVGISPNVEIKPTLDDVKKGRDAALEAARKQLGA